MKDSTFNTLFPISPFAQIVHPKHLSIPTSDKVLNAKPETYEIFTIAKGEFGKTFSLSDIARLPNVDNYILVGDAALVVNGSKATAKDVKAVKAEDVSSSSSVMTRYHYGADVYLKALSPTGRSFIAGKPTCIIETITKRISASNYFNIKR